MKQICPDELCCGCSVCEDVCPKHCISMAKHANGFLYPQIDQNTCIDCKLCQYTCPEHKIIKLPVNPHLYAARAVNESDWNRGSSGGLFGILATNIIKVHNGIVYGAAFDKDLKLRHVRISSLDDLMPLCKSKYITSDIRGIYKQIREDCKAGAYVLFCGTPCQCAALRKLLNKDYDNLLIVDFLCHGVPSLDLWQKSIVEYGRKHKAKIINFIFRAKPSKPRKNADHYFDITLIKPNGKKIVKMGRPSWEFPFYYHYTRYLGFRPSCYDCRYCTQDRMGDLTIADFWKLERLLPDVNPADRYSAIVVNNEKGENWLEAVKDRLWIKARPVDDLIKLNPTYTRGTMITHESVQSLADLERLPFEEYAKRHMTAPKMDIFSRSIRFAKRKIKL